MCTDTCLFQVMTKRVTRDIFGFSDCTRRINKSSGTYTNGLGFAGSPTLVLVVFMHKMLVTFREEMICGYR